MKQLLETRYTLDPALFDELLDRSQNANSYRVNVARGPFINDPTQLEWVFNTRTDLFFGDYEISSLWNIGTVMPDFAREMVELMSSMTNIQFCVPDFYLVRTKGNVPIHKDLGTTLSKFNFGVHNSDLALTTMYDENRQVSTCVNMQNGRGYLLNPHAFHSVDSKIDKDVNQSLVPYRYIATFKTTLSFEQVALRHL